MQSRRNQRYQKTGLSETQQDYHIARRRMVQEQLRAETTDRRVLDAMAKIPRHLFVEEGLWGQAYSDRPLSIGEGQTISQPRIVAMMTAALQLMGDEKVLEIGTGCGYQTAVLCECAREVYSIERIGSLSHRARRRLYEIGDVRFHLRIGDGTVGWPEHAPFDAIIVTAGAPAVPDALVQQLADGGRLVIPVGGECQQQLLRMTRRGRDVVTERLTACRFVKLIGEAGWPS
ncbi:MAG: protein-L-isoaspartate(D-aspartate) O-methyltransferase [Deltaproteobacteria bacterium]|nr:protein-L-isoaspartate(D-aspartate) O-methyltransferase [Deltaproteobacteria bacterium]